MSIWNFLFSLFTSLFGATEAAWKKLPDSVQTGIVNGSGIFNIISQYVGQDPKLTIATIQANYPQEDLTLLYTGLAAVAKVWGLTIPPDLESLIVTIQGKIKSLEGSELDRILSGAGQILADVLTGEETPFEVIVTVIQWVFTNIVKPKDIVFASIPSTPAVDKATIQEQQTNPNP